MRVLVNASTLMDGGCVQVGTTFVQYASQPDVARDCEFLFAVSRLVYENLPEDLQADPRVRLVVPSPARIVRGHRSRRILKEMEEAFAPDVVYSIGSPSYTRFRRPEIARFTDPWVTHPTPLAQKALPVRRRIYTKALARYKVLWLRRCKYFETQSEAARDGLLRLLPWASGRIRIIPNAYSTVFSQAASGIRHFEKDGVCRVLVLAVPYHHKNLTMIPRIASLFKARGAKQYRFVVTLPDSGEAVREFWRLATKLRVEDRIENVGRVRLSDCCALYREADLVFLPTLLETFSVTYLEAMKMGKPIVTTDLDFARNVCGDAAVYYDPLSPEAAAEAIERVASDHALKTRLVANGDRRIGEFPPPEEKYRMVIDWIREVAADRAVRDF